MLRIITHGCWRIRHGYLITPGILKVSILKCFKTSSDPFDPGVLLSKELDLYMIRLVKEKVKPENEKSQRHRKRFPSGKCSRVRSNGYYQSFSRRWCLEPVTSHTFSSISQEHTVNAVLVSRARLACETNAGYCYSFSRSENCNSKHFETISHFLNTL